jgi:hypothetical protein
MSRRPKGPSDRGAYYDDFDTTDAPRLEQSTASKLMVSLLLVCYCSVAALVAVGVCSAWVRIATADGQGGRTPDAFVPAEHRARLAAPHLQRSVLHRLAMLRKATAPQRGVDLDSVRLAFPHWLLPGDQPRIDASVALADVVLALSYIVREGGQSAEQPPGEPPES